MTYYTYLSVDPAAMVAGIFIARIEAHPSSRSCEELRPGSRAGYRIQSEVHRLLMPRLGPLVVRMPQNIGARPATERATS